MKERNITTIYKRIPKYIFLIFVSFNLTSCFLGFNADDDPFIVGTNNTYRGIVVDTNGNPVVGKTVILSGGFDQDITEYVTDENGLFEGQGDIYDTGLQVEIKNDGDFPNVDINFVQYDFRYTEYPSEQVIEIPPLIYAPISFFSIDITNNTGENYVAEYQYIIGSCNKGFEDDIETYSLCYEEDARNFNLADTTGPFRRSVFALRGSTIIVTLSNNISTITESYVIDEINQEETIIFE
jgi:hypothetical protein